MSTLVYSNRVETVARLLAEADFVLIGAGAGLSAAGGLNYLNPALFQDWYPQFARLGLSTIWDAIVAHWAPNDQNRRRFWAFWAYHIQKIRYDAPAGAPYLNLARLVARRPHFVITTNVDGQFTKAGFPPEVVFTPQGDYGKFQCATPCNDALYDNQGLVRELIANTDRTDLLVRESHIPRCPSCGGYLDRNLRRDECFVESPYMAGQAAYQAFLNRSASGKLVLLELGVGFNTPGIIRWPFERITLRHPNAFLVRVNVQDAQVPGNIQHKAIGFQEGAEGLLTRICDSNG